jgi:hypothetical protein
MKESTFASPGLQILDAELGRKKEMLESFIYNCSHSIRSPLKSMEGIVKLLKKYPNLIVTDKVDYRQLLRGEARRLQTIVSHFDEMRLNAEKPLTITAIDVPKMADRIMKPFHPRFEALEIKANTLINQKGQFLSDAARIETVVSELVLNAIKFHDPAEGKRVISMYITASPASCSIQVHDNGMGIRTEDLSKVFDLFFRGNEKSDGTGLGLFVAKQITEKMRGTLTAQSAPGKNTIFSLWIPNRKR